MVARGRQTPHQQHRPSQRLAPDGYVSTKMNKLLIVAPLVLALISPAAAQLSFEPGGVTWYYVCSPWNRSACLRGPNAGYIGRNVVILIAPQVSRFKKLLQPFLMDEVGRGQTGGGISMRCSSPSMANSCTSGVPWTQRRRGFRYPRSTTARPSGGTQADAETSEEARHHFSHRRHRQAPILRFCAARTWCCVASRHRSLEE